MGFTVNNTFGEMLKEPLFQGWRHMLDFRRSNEGDWLEELTITEFAKRRRAWNAETLGEGINYLYEKSLEGQVFYPIWNADEIQKDPGKEQTGIAALTLPKKSKFVLICPGGAYSRVCSVSEGYPLAKKLNEMGYAVFVLSYRAGKNALFPQPLEDVAAAIRFITQHASEFQVDTEGYCLIGFSAGAHLAGCFGLKEIGYSKYNVAKPGTIVLGYPLVNLLHDSSGSTVKVKDNILGEAGKSDLALLRKYSIDINVTSDYPPTYVWQCDEDPVVSIENAMRMVMALRQSGVPVGFEAFHYSTHGVWTDAEDYPKMWIERAVAFWENVSSRE